MLKSTFITLSMTAFLLSACATNSGPEYNGSNYNQIKHFQLGTVVSERAVVITDSGAGKFLGAIIGAVLGSTIGQGNGSTLASLGGGLVGGYAGSEVGKANADELTVELDNGEQIVVVVKGKNYEIGDKIKIIKDGNSASQVYKVEEY